MCVRLMVGRCIEVSLNSKSVAGEGELHGRVIFFQCKMACRRTLLQSLLHRAATQCAPRGDNRGVMGEEAAVGCERHRGS